MTGNPHFLALIQFLNFLRTATQTTRAIEATQESMSQQVKIEHRSILEAIARQDPEASCRRTSAHGKGNNALRLDLFRPRGKSSTGLNSRAQTRQIAGVPEVFEACCLGKVLSCQVSQCSMMQLIPRAPRVAPSAADNRDQADQSPVQRLPA